VIHNLPVIAKMAAVGKACGNMFQLQQGNSAETSGGLLICLPRYHRVGCSFSYQKVLLLFRDPEKPIPDLGVLQLQATLVFEHLFFYYLR
jgi:hypothetical protein